MLTDIYQIYADLYTLSNQFISNFVLSMRHGNTSIPLEREGYGPGIFQLVADELYDDSSVPRPSV